MTNDLCHGTTHCPSEICETGAPVAACGLVNSESLPGSYFPGIHSLSIGDLSDGGSCGRLWSIRAVSHCWTGFTIFTYWPSEIWVTAGAEAFGAWGWPSLIWLTGAPVGAWGLGNGQ
jgi:hypothetical protein